MRAARRSPPGGSAPGPAAPSATARPAAAAASRAVTLNCGLAPASLVGPALGLTGLGAPQQEASGHSVICVYSQGTVTVGMANDATAAMMRAGQAQASMGGWKTSAYPGLGDEAFSGTVPAQDGMPVEYSLPQTAPFQPGRHVRRLTDLHVHKIGDPSPDCDGCPVTDCSQR